jgi:hypothetical protein
VIEFAMPTIDLTDAEHAALVALIRRTIEEDRFPRAPRLDPLRSALAKLNPAAAASLRRPLTPKNAKPSIRKPTLPKDGPRGS